MVTQPPRPLTISNLGLGMSSAPDFLRDGPPLRYSINTRRDFENNAVGRYGTDLVKNLSTMNNPRTFKFESLGGDVLFAGDNDNDGDVDLFLFDKTGTAITIQQQASFTFNSGGTQELVIGDAITGATSGATGTVTKVKLDSGSWSGGTATGTVTFRWTNAITFINAENVNVGGFPNILTTTSAQSTVNFSYLGADATKLRTLAIEDSIIILNVATTVATSTAPSGTVTGDVKDYATLAEKTGVAVGDIYKTSLSTPGFPIGYYKAYRAHAAGPPLVNPLYTRIPKPSQSDALYDATTMMHRLLKISDTVYEWQRIDYDPRLSGGDIEGQDPNGNNIIRNEAVLKGRKIVGMALWGARLHLILDDKTVVSSASRGFFNFWLDDVYQTVPSDRIVDEIIGENTGLPLFMVSTEDAVFIAMEHAQVQYSARGEALSAGGTDQVYNGRVEIIGRMQSSTVQPVTHPGVVFFVDANNVIWQFIWFGENTNKFMLRDPASETVHKDISAETITLMRVNDNVLYVLTANGRVWRWQVVGQDRNSSLIGSWSRYEMDEAIVFVWGYSSRLYMLVEYLTYFSIVKLPESDVLTEAGFDTVPVADRMERVEGTYDAGTNRTTFTVNTTPDVDETVLVLAHNLVQVPFENGSAAIALGDTITGGTSGASGYVYRVALWGGSAWGAAGYGLLHIRRTDDVEFTVGEDIKVGGVTKAVVEDGGEEIIGVVGEEFSPVSVGATTAVFTGDFGPLAADAGSVTVEHILGRYFERSMTTPLLWAPASSDRIQTYMVTTFHQDTTDYDVEMSRKGEIDTFEFTAKVTGEYEHGATPTETDCFTIPYGADGHGLTITVKSTSTGQFKISLIEVDYERIRL